LRILIVQPTVPKYRVSFFNSLHEDADVSLDVIGDTDASVSSAEYDVLDWYKETSSMKLVFGFWCQKLRVQPRDYDVVVIFGNPRYLSNLVLLFNCKAVSTKVIWWTQLNSFSSSVIGTWIRLFLARAADGIIFYTDEEQKKFKNLYGDGPPSFALNNSIDTNSIQKLSKAYDPEKRGKNLLFIGRLISKINLDLLFEGIKLLGDKDVRLHIIGDGYLRRDLLEKAKALDVDDQIIWYGEIRDEKSIAAIANECCLMVYPGAIGLALLHAMAYGLPTIIHSDASKHGPEAIYLNNAACGYTFLEGDAVDLASVIRGALIMSTTRHEQSLNAKLAVSTLYNIESMSSRMRSALKAILAGGDYAGEN